MEYEGKKIKKNICIAVLAHVDAGKTTLSEGLLYISKSIRKLGRVDNKDAFLDTYELERARGITIFSKQARLQLGDLEVTLLDTPGHVDFSAEMERTLQVLDYAILVISAADGVQGHTKTLWKLLGKYKVPTFIFVNKMDQNGTDKHKSFLNLEKHLCKEVDSTSDIFDGKIQFVDFTDEMFKIKENMAMCDVGILESYLETGDLDDSLIIELIKERKAVPCFFGSALKLEGVEQFAKAIEKYTKQPEYGSEFGAKVFKIARDNQDNRLTYMKITGGSLKVKDELAGEKVNQIRIYSGVKFETVNEAFVGIICAVAGPDKTYIGQGFGIESEAEAPLLSPVLTYKIILPEGCDSNSMLPKFKLLQEEEPQLHINWNENLKEIQVELMGDIQIEILKNLINERFGVEVEFGTGNIVYKETIGKAVEGVGHYEPLRHYAEVHLLMEPGQTGTGLDFSATANQDSLDKNWQRLILTHLKERKHKGVLGGFPITDMKITLIAGRAHQKHTEGGDFRQATYRAVRQGLMSADNVLLEPYYDFVLEVPRDTVGRAMSDIDKMHGQFEQPAINKDMSVISGSAPVSTMRDYHKEVSAYTRGMGRLFCTVKRYMPCHNAKEVLENQNYDSESDAQNPSSSVFCSHGAGFVVKWNEVRNHMHIDTELPFYAAKQAVNLNENQNSAKDMGDSKKHNKLKRDEQELENIFVRTYGGIKDSHNIFHTTASNDSLKVKSKKNNVHRVNSNNKIIKSKSQQIWKGSKKTGSEEYMLIDGYNIIFAWPDLKELASINIDGARDKLLDVMCNYQGVTKCHLTVVFDAYKVEGHKGESTSYHNINVVYTKEAQTADQYIEMKIHEMKHKYNVTVATSDGLEQITVINHGCKLMSANELLAEVKRVEQQIKDKIESQKNHKNYLFNHLPKDMIDYMQDVRLGKNIDDK